MNLHTSVRAFAITCTGLATGVFLGHWRGVSIAMSQLEPTSFVHLQQIIHVHFVPMMPILLFGAAVASLAWSLSLRNYRKDATFWLVTGSAMAMAIVLGLTLVVNVPINRELMTWNAEMPPANFAVTWARWELSHSVRTVLAIAAFVSQAMALSLAGSRSAVTAA